MEKKDYRLAAILYTDIAGFSKMLEKNEALTLELLQTHNEIVEEIVAAHGGKVIKTIGDAFLIDFKNTVDALQSAIEIQYRLHDYNDGHRDLPLLVRIGVHLGDIYFYENDALGEGINIAARLQSIAHPGCICMSGDVYNHVLNKVDFKAEKLGRVSLKNITKEIHAYEIVTPNVEFDPNRGAPTILAPGKEEPAAADSTSSQTRAPDAASSAAPFSAEDLRRRILLDIKAAGTRLSVDEAMKRYGGEDPSAPALIEKLAEKGFLVKSAARTSAGTGLDESSGETRYDGEADWRRYVSERMDRGWPEVREGIREARREARHAIRDELRERRRDAKLKGSRFYSPADSAEDFDSYAKKVRAEAHGAIPGFIGHLIPFVAVNAGLMALNAAVSPSFPWAIFPLGGWGIGVLEHLTAAMRRLDRARDLRRLPAMNADQLQTFKQLQKRKDSFHHQWASSVSTSVFLAAINLVVSPGFLWFLFPAAAMGLGLLTRSASYAAKKAELERALLESFGLAGRWNGALRKMPAADKEPAADYGRFQALVEESRTLRSAIADQVGAGTKKNSKKGLRGSPAAHVVDEDFLPTLDSYVDQVALLAAKTIEVDGIIDLIPVDVLRADRERMKAKLGGEIGDSLRREYEKSVAEIDRQESSYEELREQREVLELRVGSAVNTMKQMRIDLARIAGLNAGNDSASLNSLREKTAELNRYLADLRFGYDDLDALESESIVSGSSE